MSRLAKVLAKYETKSRSAEESSSGRETKVMTSQVSRDACKLFLSSGRSFEAEVYRQLVVGRINDGDITTALQLCCIGHQMLFDRNILDAISSISDHQTLGDNFEQMNKCPLYIQERTTFLSVCNEWCKALEPQGLMTNGENKLLKNWIIERKYANIKDSIVSLMIEKCSTPKKEEKKRKKEEAKKRKEKAKNREEEAMQMKRRRDLEFERIEEEAEQSKNFELGRHEEVEQRRLKKNKCFECYIL